MSARMHLSKAAVVLFKSQHAWHAEHAIPCKTLLPQAPLRAAAAPGPGCTVIPLAQEAMGIMEFVQALIAPQESLRGGSLAGTTVSRDTQGNSLYHTCQQVRP